MLGIEDPQVWLAYVSCVLSALGCVIYGALNWKEEKQVLKNSSPVSALQE
ncbi:MAG: hypothetical protein PHD26_09675 [Methanosarcinaceae archaeon]|nr:hypothetical protein [Methanosarcinaceae archaeon]MDD4750164.1 hypothetical protein [Methanosarcinaceae archaeon]